MKGNEAKGKGRRILLGAQRLKLTLQISKKYPLFIRPIFPCFTALILRAKRATFTRSKEHFIMDINYSHLLTLQWDSSLITSWLSEDIPSFDYGGLVVGNRSLISSKSSLLIKQDATIFGRALTILFQAINKKLQFSTVSALPLYIQSNTIIVADSIVL